MGPNRHSIKMYSSKDKEFKIPMPENAIGVEITILDKFSNNSWLDWV